MRTITLLLCCGAFIHLTLVAAETNDVPMSEWQSRLAATASSILPSISRRSCHQWGCGAKACIAAARGYDRTYGFHGSL
ncbi:MAG TPA: hypothetical protein VFZ59_13570 [Verrucomicrobiae bacterium]|nr:hypothetical protein [Verrucomicrobiae bacterium]